MKQLKLGLIGIMGVFLTYCGGSAELPPGVIQTSCGKLTNATVSSVCGLTVWTMYNETLIEGGNNYLADADPHQLVSTSPRQMPDPYPSPSPLPSGVPTVYPKCFALWKPANPALLSERVTFRSDNSACTFSANYEGVSTP